MILLAQADLHHPTLINMQTNYAAGQLPALTKSAKTNSQSRYLLSLAAAPNGMNHIAAARIGGLERQTLRERGLRFTHLGPE